MESLIPQWPGVDGGADDLPTNPGSFLDPPLVAEISGRGIRLPNHRGLGQRIHRSGVGGRIIVHLQAVGFRQSPQGGIGRAVIYEYRYFRSGHIPGP